MRSNDFPKIPIGTIGGVGGWYFTMRQEIEDIEVYYYPFIYTRDQKPRMMFKVCTIFRKNDGSSEINENRIGVCLGSGEGPAGFGYLINDWLDETEYLKNGGITIEYGLQIEGILSPDNIWTFNFHDRVFDYALNGVHTFENAREHLERDNFPIIPIGTIGGIDRWYLTMLPSTNGNKTCPVMFDNLDENRPTLRCRFYLSILKNDGLSVTPKEEIIFLKYDDSLFGEFIFIDELLNEENGNLTNGGITIEYGFQIEGFLSPEEVWTFNFHDRLFDFSSLGGLLLSARHYGFSNVIQLLDQAERFNGPEFLTPFEYGLSHCLAEVLKEQKTLKELKRRLKNMDLEAMSGEMMKKCDGSLPVESSERDWLLMPVLFVCAFTVTALGLVAAVQIARSRRHYKDNIQQIAEQLDGKTSFAYQDLCRQRADGGRASKSSSTSSWCEETAAPTIDISTGHVVLNFLQEYLSEPTKIEAQWNGIKDYHNEERKKTKAEKFSSQNRTILPFDDNIVDIDGKTSDNEDYYLNASFIYDDDPRQAVYIAAQTPASNQIAAFWQTIWQHGVCLVVNLSTPEECKQEKNYWPDTGSEVHGAFEIHLVSEHIWSDDYLVRSFYLKNLQNSQTRTITQFHYLSWQKDSTPTSAKSILEFRRKVNKSYRGRSSAVLVHSWDGSGRTGVYCAVDVLCARLLRGIRQIDVVATVEHLRDQRDGMVATGDQFKLVYGCVAQEVNHLLKSIAAQ
uniref:Tyrosine-protein phosphatase domain-containing protein n=2 Tax=Caenorhabditis tropicalis TaxID=1561998 RepID=A0A1I7TB31_9PELO